MNTYCEKPEFGQIPPSFSLNSGGYSPQAMEKFVSNQASLATAS